METDKEVISRLKFIGKIQKGEKINVKYMYVQQEGLITKLIRTLINQCNRQNTLNFVRSTIDKTFEIVKKCNVINKEYQQNIFNNIIEDLKNSKNGMINLKETYISDTKFGCDIDTLIQEINNKIIELHEN